MRGQHHVSTSGQRMVGLQRLGLVDVQGGPAEVPGVEGGHQGFGVEHCAAGGVDQQAARWHQRQFPLRDQVPAVVGQLHVQADHVRAGKQLVPLDVPKPHPRGLLGVGMKRPGHHLHPEGEREPDHLGADVAGADHAERLARERGGEHLVPVVSLHGLGEVGGLARDGHHQGKRVLGHHRCGAARDIRDGDPQFPARDQVDRIGADAAGTDELQFRQLSQHFTGPGHRSSRIDDRGGSGGPSQFLVVVGGPVVKQADLVVFPQRVQSGGPGDLDGVVTGDHQ